MDGKKKYKSKSINFVDLKIIFFICLSLLILGYIFSNSVQGASASNAKSKSISKTIQSIVDPEKKIEEAEFHKCIRKAAHALEFAALGICIGGTFYNIYLKKGKKYISLPILLCLSSGICDEFIQSFNKERSSEVRDVLIDFGGATFGLLIILLTAVLIYKRKKEN